MDILIGVKRRVFQQQDQGNTQDNPTRNEMKTDIFLSHDWGIGCKNHKRVSKINDALKKVGYETWFDGEKMAGDIREKMAEGIQQTRCCIDFLTKRYHDKVVKGSDRDNCTLEFNFASHRVPMIAVVLDSEMKDTSTWEGNIGLTLISRMYVDMAGNINDDSYLAKQVKLLQNELSHLGINPCREETTATVAEKGHF